MVKISTNQYGEFDKGCLCGSHDFFTAISTKDGWREIDPVTKWDGWFCVSCTNVYNDAGVLLEEHAPVERDY